MKSLLTSLILAIVLVSCSTSEEPSGYTISAEVTNGEDVLIKLDRRQDGEWITLDSTVVENGAFTLSGAVEGPEMVYLKFIEGDEVNYTTVFLENTDITIKGDADDVDFLDISGSASHDQYGEYAAGLETITEPYDTLYELHSLAESDAIKDSLEDLIEIVAGKEEAYALDYIKENAASPVAPYIALRSVAYHYEFDELKPVVDQMDAVQSGSKYLTTLHETLDKLEILTIGATIEFDQDIFTISNFGTNCIS